MPLIELHPWAEENLSLLEGINTPEMTKYLGGPETSAQLLRRHQRYLEAATMPVVRVFKIVQRPDYIPVGQVCYWERTWYEQPVWESGWGVLPAYQGQGIASQAVILLLEKARSEKEHRFVHAFPAVENTASNGLCQKLGFSKLEECDFEYPPGNWLRCNDWQFDLFEDSAQEEQASPLPNGLSRPALRALASLGIQNLEQLTDFSETEIIRLHGFGPNGLNKLRQAMAAKGLTFAHE